MRRTPAGTEVERHDQRCTAPDAMALDRGNGDLVHVLPGLAHLGAEPLAVDALAHRQALALAALGILEVEAGREGLGGSGQDHHRRFEIVLEHAGRIAQLPHRALAQGIDIVATVEAHDGDAALGAKPLLDLHELTVHRARSSGIWRDRKA